MFASMKMYTYNKTDSSIYYRLFISTIGMESRCKSESLNEHKSLVILRCEHEAIGSNRKNKRASDHMRHSFSLLSTTYK